MPLKEGDGQESRKARAQDKILPFLLGDANQFFLLVTFKMAPSFHHICHIYVCNMLRKGVPRTPTNKTIARTSHSSNISPNQLTPKTSGTIVQQKRVLLVRSLFQVRSHQFDRSYDIFIVSFYVLFVCKCVLYYCHRVSTQLQLTNISYDVVEIPDLSGQGPFAYEPIYVDAHRTLSEISCAPYQF